MMSELVPAYVLHTRAYRDTSLLVDLMTAESGRIALVARGARRGSRNKTPQSNLLQPFRPLLVSFVGRRQLKTLTGVEAAGNSVELKGERLFSGLYINELVVRLLHADDPHPQIFYAYAQVLEQLASVDLGVEGVLRSFEFSLLEELGYGFDLTVDGHSGNPLNAEAYYSYHSEYGLVSIAAGADAERPRFRGADLIAMVGGDQTPEVRRVAKLLMREALSSHLAGKPLRSRELFQQATVSQAAPAADQHCADAQPLEH